MALDTRGFATGFTQGFGMMDQYQARQRQAEMQKQQLGLQQEQWQYRQDQDALTRERQAKQDAQTEKENQYTQDQRTMQSIYANIGAGNLSLDHNTSKTIDEIYSRNPSLVAMPLKKTIQDRRSFAQNQEAQQATIGSIQKLFMPDAELTGQDAQAIMSANVDVSRAAQPAAQDAVAIVERVFNPNDDFNENSPQALGAFNYIFGDLVGEGKRITGVYPGRTAGTIVLDLDTQNAKGVPLTANRGTAEDGDDEVLEIPVEKAINALTGFKALSQEFAMNPDAAQKAMRFARSMGLAPEVKDKGKSQVHTEKEYNEAGMQTGERSFVLTTDPKTGRQYKQYLEEEPLEGGEITDEEIIAAARVNVKEGKMTPAQFEALYGVSYQQQAAPPTASQPIPTEIGRPTMARPQSQQASPADDTTNILMRGGL